MQEMEYLGYTDSGGKLSVLTNKFVAVKEWTMPKTLREVRRFVHFCIFYAKFIHHFCDVSAPLAHLLRNKSNPQKIVMTPACPKAFETLKLRVISAPCMPLPEVSSDPTLTVVTYASAVGIAIVLLQGHEGGLQSLSYWAHKLNNIERGNSYDANDLKALYVCQKAPAGGASAAAPEGGALAGMSAPISTSTR
jgi:hypothetical protein